MNRSRRVWRRLGRAVLISTAGAFAWGEIALHLLQPLFYFGITIGVLAGALMWAVKEIRGRKHDRRAREPMPSRQTRQPREIDRADRPLAL